MSFPISNFNKLCIKTVWLTALQKPVITTQDRGVAVRSSRSAAAAAVKANPHLQKNVSEKETNKQNPKYFIGNDQEQTIVLPLPLTIKPKQPFT